MHFFLFSVDSQRRSLIQNEATCLRENSDAGQSSCLSSELTQSDGGSSLRVMLLNTVLLAMLMILAY